MLSSLPLQILFFFNGWYDVAFTIAMSSLYAWKGSTLPYPDELRPMLGLEVAIVFLLAIIEYARIFLGTKGNKTEQSGPLLMSLVLGVPAMIANVYFLRLQIYVTRADLVRRGPEPTPPAPPAPPAQLRTRSHRRACSDFPPRVPNQVLNAISIAFVGLEILLSCLTIITFAKAPPPQGDN